MMGKWVMAMGWNSGLTQAEREEREINLRVPFCGYFYDTGRWGLLRQKTIMKHGPVCQKCGSGGDSQNPIQVDHIKPRSKYPELEYDLNNLQVLCKNCNHEKSNVDETDWRP